MYLMGSEEREREAFGEEFGLDGLEELDAGLERERERRVRMFKRPGWVRKEIGRLGWV